MTMENIQYEYEILSENEGETMFDACPLYVTAEEQNGSNGNMAGIGQEPILHNPQTMESSLKAEVAEGNSPIANDSENIATGSSVLITSAMESGSFVLLSRERKREVCLETKNPRSELIILDQDEEDQSATGSGRIKRGSGKRKGLTTDREACHQYNLQKRNKSTSNEGNDMITSKTPESTGIKRKRSNDSSQNSVSVDSSVSTSSRQLITRRNGRSSEQKLSLLSTANDPEAAHCLVTGKTIHTLSSLQLPVKCRCGKVYTTIFALTRHIMESKLKPEEKYTCQICLKEKPTQNIRFMRKENLEKHIRVVHKDKRKGKDCEICGTHVVWDMGSHQRSIKCQQISEQKKLESGNN